MVDSLANGLQQGFASDFNFPVLDMYFRPACFEMRLQHFYEIVQTYRPSDTVFEIQQVSGFAAQSAQVGEISVLTVFQLPDDDLHLFSS